LETEAFYFIWIIYLFYLAVKERTLKNGSNAIPIPINAAQPEESPQAKSKAANPPLPAAR
jgi:hypothetical protein